MNRKPHAGSVTDRSGDRRIISASLTRENCPCLGRFHGDATIFNPPGVFPQNPGISRVVPVFSPEIPGCSTGFPVRSPVVPWVPLESQSFPPSCRLFRGNPSLFPRCATRSPGIPAISPGLPAAPGDSQVAFIKQVIHQTAHFCRKRTQGTQSQTIMPCQPRAQSIPRATAVSPSAAKRVLCKSTSWPVWVDSGTEMALQFNAKSRALIIWPRSFPKVPARNALGPWPASCSLLL